jgi:hypothetical protein
MYFEAQSFRGSQDLSVFKRAKQLRHILHGEDRSAGAFYNLEKWPPELFSGITLAILVEEAESLTRRATDHNVGLRNPG